MTFRAGLRWRVLRPSARAHAGDNGDHSSWTSSLPGLGRLFRRLSRLSSKTLLAKAAAWLRF